MMQFWNRAFLDWTEGRRSPGLACFGALAWLLSWPYRAGRALDARLRRIPLRALSGDTLLIVLSSPVVGGVGKTPLAAHLAGLLRQSGTDVHIVTTGYRRSSRGHVSLMTTCPPVTTAQTGDEAMMLYQMTGVPVHVGADLGDVVARVESEFHPRVVIVDDGVRRRWQNERRVVVLAASDLERPVRFLPYGRWRMPPGHAWPAAGVAILDTMPRVPDAGETVLTANRNRRLLRAWGYAGPVGWYQTVSDGLIRLGEHVVSSPPDRHPSVFCGLGMPSRFLRQVEAGGFTPTSVQRFPDHHTYTAADLASLAGDCRRTGGTWMLTTHKDAVKIDPAWTQTLPVFWLRISLELTGGDDMLPVILETKT